MNIRRQHILLLVLTLIIAGFIALSVLVVLYPSMPIDLKISHEIQDIETLFSTG